MSQTDRTNEGAAGSEVSTRSGAPLGPDVGPLKLLVAIAGLAVVAFGVFVLVSAMQRPDDSTPRTAAERTLIDAQNAIAEDPRDVEARVALARVYIGMGQIESALRTLDAAEKIEPDNLAVTHMLGLTYLESGDAVAAISYLQRAADIEGGFADDYVGVWADMGRARELQGDLEGAAEAYQQALVYTPQAGDIIFELAQVYERLGLTDEAARAYEGVLTYLPEHQGAREALGRLRSTDG